MATEIENTCSLTENKEMPVETNGSSEVQNGSNDIPTVVNEEVKSKILKQIEYYFGNYNLPRDKFLKEQTNLNDGWIALDVMVKFKRLALLSTDHNVIRDAVKISSIVEVDDATDSIRRSPDNPLPHYGDDLKAETVKRTIYCKGFPKDGSLKLDDLLEFFKKFGPYENVHMRNFYDRQTKKGGFKGSVLVVFPDADKAKEFVDIDDVQFRGKPLLRKWHQDYIDEKENEFKERQERKKAKLEKANKGGEEGEITDGPKLTELEPLPRGAFVFLSGFKDAISREEIKEALSAHTDDVAFIEYNRGDADAYVRLKNAYTNEELVEKLGHDFKVKGEAITVRAVEGDEEEDQLKKATEARTRASNKSGQKRKWGGGFGRGRGGRGGFKRRRN